MRYTKQLNLNGYIGANIKGRVLQIMGNLPFELARLATVCYSDPHCVQIKIFPITIFWLIQCRTYFMFNTSGELNSVVHKV